MSAVMSEHSPVEKKLRPARTNATRQKLFDASMELIGERGAAGVTVEKRLESFAAFPALLVLVPPFLGQSGSLGGILSSRVSTKHAPS